MMSPTELAAISFLVVYGVKLFLTGLFAASGVMFPVVAAYLILRKFGAKDKSD